MMLTKERVEQIMREQVPYGWDDVRELCRCYLERLAMNNTHMPIAGDRPDLRPTVKAIITTPKVPHE